MSLFLNHDTTKPFSPHSAHSPSPPTSEGVSQSLSRGEKNNFEALCQCHWLEEKVG